MTANRDSVHYRMAFDSIITTNGLC